MVAFGVVWCYLAAEPKVEIPGEKFSRSREWFFGGQRPALQPGVLDFGLSQTGGCGDRRPLTALNVRNY